MKADLIFSIANVIAIVGWLLLAIGPGWGITRRIVLSGILPLLLSIAYLVLILLFFGRAEVDSVHCRCDEALYKRMGDAGGVDTLPGFDIFIGAWEVRDAQERGVLTSWLSPVSCSHFLGPIGLLLYHIIRHFTPGGEDAEIVDP